jgi:glutathione S-transferase
MPIGNRSNLPHVWAYLAEKYPDRGFIPADAKLRADFYRWILFAVTELEQP